MDEKQQQGQITLADSLKADAGWEIFNFGYNGPNPPYVRIGLLFRPLDLNMEPCFESFIRDRVIFRSKVSMESHLRKYRDIKIDPVVFEEHFGRKYTTNETFPFGEWLHVLKVLFGEIVLAHPSIGIINLPSHVLSVASGIWLSKPD
jgi:hypothetical protein